MWMLIREKVEVIRYIHKHQYKHCKIFILVKIIFFQNKYFVMLIKFPTKDLLFILDLFFHLHSFFHRKYLKA